MNPIRFDRLEEDDRTYSLYISNESGLGSLDKEQGLAMPAGDTVR
jgi:hypothetical protein